MLELRINLCCAAVVRPCAELFSFLADWRSVDRLSQRIEQAHCMSVKTIQPAAFPLIQSQSPPAMAASAHMACMCACVRACAGVLKTFQGHISFLLRHPCGASVVNALYDRCDTAQRDRMAAELYGKEYTILTQVRWCSYLCAAHIIPNAFEQSGLHCSQCFDQCSCRSCTFHAKDGSKAWLFAPNVSLYALWVSTQLLQDEFWSRRLARVTAKSIYSTTCLSKQHGSIPSHLGSMQISALQQQLGACM